MFTLQYLKNLVTINFINLYNFNKSITIKSITIKLQTFKTINHL